PHARHPGLAALAALGRAPRPPRGQRAGRSVRRPGTGRGIRRAAGPPGGSGVAGEAVAHPRGPGLRVRCSMHKSAAVVFLAILYLAGCARVYPHIALPDVQLGEPSFFPTLEAYTNSPILGQNSVDVLLNGEEIFPALLEAIRSARKTITYEQYYYEEGPVARDIADALAERCRAGVGANVLLDAFGSLSMPSEYVEVMKRAGCHVVSFRPLNPIEINRSNKRNHRRVLVVDGRVGFTGGSGVSRKWMGNGRTPDHWRDTDVRVRGPAVEYLQ